MSKGDDGTTSLINGKRLFKDHPAIECLGTIDELNAFLGDAKAVMPDTQAGQREIIKNIQTELFVISGIIAGSKAQAPGTAEIDALINEITEKLPKLSGFVIPGTNPVSAKLHISRAICRRLERCLVKLRGTDIIPAADYNSLLVWFNRLSDLLFLLAQALQ